LPHGIIIKGIGGFYYVLSGDTVYECKARGIFRNIGTVPLPGDKVEITILNEKNKGNIEKILPRTNELIRPAISNINQVIVTIAARSPMPDLLLLDKLLINAALKDINAIVCINKIDLDTAGEYKAISQTYTSAGYKVLPTSTRTEEGLQDLSRELKDKISVFAGQSGVGKSTLINSIMQCNIMKTGDISSKIERGKHTTRHAELIPLKEGGFLADTPGFSSLDIMTMEPDVLQDYYPEFSEYRGGCRFSSCMHISEPDCEVKKAVESGIIDTGRYERYLTIYRVLKENYDMRFKNQTHDKYNSKRNRKGKQ